MVETEKCAKLLCLGCVYVGCLYSCAQQNSAVTDPGKQISSRKGSLLTSILLYWHGFCV